MHASISSIRIISRTGPEPSLSGKRMVIERLRRGKRVWKIHFETLQAITEEETVSSRCMYVASDPM